MCHKAGPAEHHSNVPDDREPCLVNNNKYFTFRGEKIPGKVHMNFKFTGYLNISHRAVATLITIDCWLIFSFDAHL